MDAKGVERNGYLRLIAQLTSNIETPTSHRQGLCVVALRTGQDGSSEKCTSKRLRRFRVPGELQHFRQSLSPLAEELSRFPISKESRTQPDAPFGIASFCQPIKGRTKIIMFQCEAFQPSAALCDVLIAGFFFCQHQAVRCMGAFGSGFFSARFQFLQSV